MRKAILVRANTHKRLLASQLKNYHKVTVDKDGKLDIVVGDSAYEITDCMFKINRGARIYMITRKTEKRLIRERKSIEQFKKEQFEFKGTPRVLTKEEINKPLRDKIVGPEVQQVNKENDEEVDNTDESLNNNE